MDEQLFLGATYIRVLLEGRNVAQDSLREGWDKDFIYKKIWQ